MANVRVCMVCCGGAWVCEGGVGVLGGWRGCAAAAVNNLLLPELMLEVSAIAVLP